ncbi:MAG: NifB/NifX family molybdenum-iron cluster-binding protein [Spirochaetota bacterium]
MRLAIATENGSVAAHFGRCPQYTLVDIEDGRETGRQVVANPGHEPGRIPAFLKEHGAAVVVAGGMGPRAADLFDSMGIGHVIGVQATVDAVVSGCLDGTLEGGESLCSHGSDHHGGHDHGGHHHHGDHCGSRSTE